MRISTKRNALILAFVLVLSAKGLCQSIPDSTRITYIANDGFLISSGGRKVLVDGLFKTGWGTYLTPSSAVRDKMTNARDPFDKTDLLLVTHEHADHFDADMTVNHLLNSPDCVLAAPKKVADLLKSHAKYASIQPRVLAFALDPGASGRDTTIRGVTIRAVRVRHSPYFVGGKDEYENLEHLAYLVRIGGFKFLHCGDGSIDFNEAVLQGQQLDKLNLDFLFWVYFDQSEASVRLIGQILKPKNVIPMHIPPAEWEKTAQSVSAALPGAVLFRESMETRAFVNPLSAVRTKTAGPGNFRLEGNYPNPFSARGGSAFGGNPCTQIRFRIDRQTRVALVIYDILGRKVDTLVDGVLETGAHRVLWNPASGLGGGVYFVSLSADGRSETRKLIFRR
jgi:L-ascorbate metabolism protein UlaG (beta-lactamase superfamily)